MSDDPMLAHELTMLMFCGLGLLGLLRLGYLRASVLRIRAMLDELPSGKPGGVRAELVAWRFEAKQGSSVLLIPTWMMSVCHLVAAFIVALGGLLFLLLEVTGQHVAATRHLPLLDIFLYNTALGVGWLGMFVFVVSARSEVVLCASAGGRAGRTGTDEDPQRTTGTARGREEVFVDGDTLLLPLSSRLDVSVLKHKIALLAGSLG